MSDTEEKIAFDIKKCLTEKSGAPNVFYCLAARQYIVCGYALPFGYGRVCKHPRKEEFSEITSQISPLSKPDD